MPAAASSSIRYDAVRYEPAAALLRRPPRSRHGMHDASGPPYALPAVHRASANLVDGLVAGAQVTIKAQGAMEPLELFPRGNIDSFSNKSIRMQKSAYLVCHATGDILSMDIEQFCSSQSIYQQELKYIESWVKEARLDQLKFARRTPLDIWVFMASTVFPTELSHARLSWIKCCLLVIMIDDFFEGGGSTKKMENLFALIEKWEAHDEIGYCSKNVEIIFCSIYDTSIQTGLWLDYLRANMMEVNWTRRMYVPNPEEYMSVAEVSMALGPIITMPLYLVVPEISEDMIREQEYKNLLKLTSICCHFLNDLHTYKKESSQRYVNSVLIHAYRYGGSATETSASIKAAERELKSALVVSQRELLRLVLKEGGGCYSQVVQRHLLEHLQGIASVLFARGWILLTARTGGCCGCDGS